MVVPGSPGQPAVATVAPFPGDEGVPSAAMGDVDGDGICDLVVSAGKDHAPEVVVYAGASGDGKEAFAADAGGGLSVASTQIDGTTSDNIIVGSGPGIASEAKVFAYNALQAGAAPELFSSFNPYPGDRSGVTVAAGLVSLMSGRNSIVTAPGPGSPAKVRMLDYWLITPMSIQIGETDLPLQLCSPDAARPAMIAELTRFGSDYRGGVSLAIGSMYGEFGGTERIIVSQLTCPGVIKIYSSGAALQGGPGRLACAWPRPPRGPAPTCW